MDLGVFLPVSGRAATRGALVESAQRAEELGFAAVWAADRVVLPWSIETPYPYAEDPAFIVPPDRPFLECLSVLSFLAGVTDRIALGASVLVMSFRHPLLWLRQATTIDLLSEGRLILGVGIGWMKEEFAAMGATFADRGRVGDEQLEIVERMLTNERVTFDGQAYQFEDLAFLPKAYRERLPIWVGGEAEKAQRRAGRFGDAWFPYFVRTTPDQLARGHATVTESAEEHQREVALACCLPVEITDRETPQEPDRLRGSPRQVGEALRRFADVGVTHVALQFVAPRYPDRVEQVERFASGSGWL